MQALERFMTQKLAAAEMESELEPEDDAIPSRL
jgi:hypothetical protein